MSGAVAGFGVSGSAATLQSVGNMAPQPQPGAGCKSIIESNSSSTSASASVGPISASGSTASANTQNTAACAPNYINNQANFNKYDKSTTVDQNTIIMSSNSLKAISESVNQMVVNSITSTKSVATQNVSVSQSIEITVKDVTGNVDISNVKNTSTIDLNNIANLSFSAFDNIRTDLANDVLAKFSTNTNNESMSKMQADLETSIANQNDAAIKTKRETKLEQTVSSQIPRADPTKIVTTNDDANVNINQVVSNDVKEASHLSANYTNQLDVNRIMETHVKNAVTQNFTKESLSQLSQIIDSNQKIGISVEGVGGNVSISDIGNSSNIILRQTLSSNMNVGNAIVNTVKNTLGMSTDDAVTTKNVSDVGLTSKTDLRNGNSSSGDMSSKFEYKQTITQDFGFGSSGSSLSSCISCICCIVCVLSSGLGAIMPDMSSTTEINQVAPKEKEKPEEKSSENSSSEGTGTKVGGYFYFN